ncbi:MAG: hypothetical protein KGL39_12585 [Patescibacteria group bacterium]|nr:hypothetical protein [Patescibacteria group bacterium]
MKQTRAIGMYQVRCHYPLDENWQERDKELVTAAGRKADWGGADQYERELGWEVDDLTKAQKLKRRLDKAMIPDVKVYIREE